jgi:hypothetical protein
MRSHPPKDTSGSAMVPGKAYQLPHLPEELLALFRGSDDSRDEGTAFCRS